MESKRKPLVSVTAADCDFDYFVGSGNGGQKKQKTSSACRCTHRASGAVGRAEDTRSQSQNKHLAFKRMAATEVFQKWIRMESMRRAGQLDQIEQEVERQMKKVKVEKKSEDGRWVEWSDNE